MNENFEVMPYKNGSNIRFVIDHIVERLSFFTVDGEVGNPPCPEFIKAKDPAENYYYMALCAKNILGMSVDNDLIFSHPTATSSIIEPVFHCIMLDAVEWFNCQVEGYIDECINSRNALIKTGALYDICSAISFCETDEGIKYHIDKNKPVFDGIDDLVQSMYYAVDSHVWDYDWEIFGITFSNMRPRRFNNFEDEIADAYNSMCKIGFGQIKPSAFSDLVIKTARELVESERKKRNPIIKVNRQPKKRSYAITNRRPKSLYIMKCKNTGHYKIGISANPKARESTLQSEKPSIRMVGQWDQLAGMERELHQKYAEQRIRGEWFDLTPAQVRFICHDLTSKSKQIANF